MLHQGTDTAALEMIGFKHSQMEADLRIEGTTCQEKLYCNLLGSALALAVGKKNPELNCSFSGNRPTSILIAKQLKAATLGELVALYEHKTAFQGYIWGLNSFDQEGVKLGKSVSEEFLKVLKKELNDPLKRVFLDLL
jgi:glucose-6-phosphate isomerase